MNTTSAVQLRQLKARRMLRHAQILVTTEDRDSYRELESAMRLVNAELKRLNVRGAQGIIKGRVARHECGDCEKYRSGRSLKQSYKETCRKSGERKLSDIVRSRMRFAKCPKPELTGDCWIWTGSMVRGYGKIHGYRVHRLMYQRVVGPIPELLVLDHLLPRSCVHQPIPS